jgi:hypothetical protein
MTELTMHQVNQVCIQFRHLQVSIVHNFFEGTTPWYFGWSNCDAETAEVLRKYYDRPYFLPLASENNAVDWIFMGGPGLGAHMHVQKTINY